MRSRSSSCRRVEYGNKHSSTTPSQRLLGGSVRSHAASGQNGERAVNTSTRIISAECVFKLSVDAATAAPPLCRLAPPIPCKIGIFCMWTYWRVGCQQLHLHHFRVKACFRFYLQVDAWTAVPSFCRQARKIFFVYREPSVLITCLGTNEKRP